MMRHDCPMCAINTFYIPDERLVPNLSPIYGRRVIPRSLIQMEDKGIEYQEQIPGEPAYHRFKCPRCGFLAFFEEVK